ncbi:hypothetical protein PanWU01x14_123050 [Parasponia andersonii]|uniref:Uncharacterized protein n=1 Tax=Parasponia andersonii TaxID=3476 RepID=A0A2P5CU57_PARAD|nr:hypothetical protein PanWU01x14_123050 [Parasponia andersonii]
MAYKLRDRKRKQVHEDLTSSSDSEKEFDDPDYVSRRLQPQQENRNLGLNINIKQPRQVVLALPIFAVSRPKPRGDRTSEEETAGEKPLRWHDLRSAFFFGKARRFTKALAGAASSVDGQGRGVAHRAVRWPGQLRVNSSRCGSFEDLGEEEGVGGFICNFQKL